MIAIGSKNQIKVEALEEVLRDYPLLKQIKIISLEIPSNVSNQPLSLQETVQGAKNRAKGAFEAGKYRYGIGIESGLMEMADSKTRFMEFSVCCIYDGDNFYFGQSCGFALPQQVMELILNQQLDLSQACYHAGLTHNPKLGAAEGIIGVLTKGRITRKDYTKQAIITALIQIENIHLYKNISIN